MSTWSGTVSSRFPPAIFSTGRASPDAEESHGSQTGSALLAASYLWPGDLWANMIAPVVGDSLAIAPL